MFPYIAPDKLFILDKDSHLFGKRIKKTGLLPGFFDHQKGRNQST